MDSSTESSDEDDGEERGRDVNLKIKSTKMPSLSRNKWISIVLNFLRSDLKKINWSIQSPDNMNGEERRGLIELKNDASIVIKNSDKGGNIVIMNDEDYVDEIERQCKDESTYMRLTNNLLPDLISELNYKLILAEEVDLIPKKKKRS